MNSSSYPLLGCGVGLRPQHYTHITQNLPAMDWFEATTENYMETGGRPLGMLEKVREHYPVVLHGVGLSIGSVDPLDEKYLSAMKRLVDRIDPAMVSDHLCWSSVGNYNLHDLLPLPFTEEAIRHIVPRVQEVQERLRRPILLENVSSYITYQHSVVPEWEFLAEVARRSGCGILLDINNVYVNCVNHGWNAREYVKNVPADKIGYIHLAGHTNMGSWLFDTHSAAVIEPVWDLYAYALSCWGQKSTLVEWDENIPEWDALSAEAAKARRIYDASARSSVSSLGDCHAPAGLAMTRGNDEQHISLAELQKWMVKRAFPQAGASEAPEVALNLQGKDLGEERLSVYADGYYARMREALLEAYEAVRHVVGHTIFSQFSQEYSRFKPSRHFNLGRAGENFEEFLKTASITGKLPFLPDLAALEWKINQAFHAYEKSKLDPQEIARIPEDAWENLSFKFQPSMAVFESAWPVVDIWKARKDPLESFNIDLVGRGQRALIFRDGYAIRCEILEPAAFVMLRQLLGGASLGEAVEAASQSTSNPDLPVSEWFAHWMQSGILTEAHEKKDPLLR